jgi:hypothetical protein
MTIQLIKGNTAVIIGAMYAGCDCFLVIPSHLPLKSCMKPHYTSLKLAGNSYSRIRGILHKHGLGQLQLAIES